GTGFRGGHGGFGGFRGGNFGRFGFRGFYGRNYWPFLYYPSYGFGYSYWPGFYDYGYNSYPVYSYPEYQPASNVTVVYPQQAQTAPAPVYVERANPVVREYDEYGQPVGQPAAAFSGSSSGSPLYLIALRDQTIRAAAAYWVDGKTLHYVTLQHEEKQAPLD